MRASIALVSTMFILACGATAEQISFTKHVVATGVDGACSVHAADVDNDGKLDVLGAAFDADTVTLWVNSGGDPTVWQPHVLVTEFDGAHWIESGDLDGDGDLDLVGASQFGGRVLSWRNDGGDPSGWTPNEIDGDFAGAQQVRPADMDGDGDIDLVGAAYYADEVVWWSNEGGSGLFWQRRTIGADFGGPVSLAVEDLDDDGDLDVITASYSGNRIDVWTNEDGLATSWSGHTLTDDFQGAHEVRTADFDNDGDPDILVVAYQQSDIRWWRNDGGNPIEWTELMIDDNFRGVAGASAADLDGDGDIDVIAAAQGSHVLAWWSNNGGDPPVWKKYVVDSAFLEVWPNQAVDMDGDGDLDILAGARRQNEISWWENTGPNGPVMPKWGFPISDE